MVIGMALAIGLAANLDNGGVGMAYGMRGVRIGWAQNLLIAGVGAAGTALFGLVGTQVAGVFPVRFDRVLAAGILILLGIGVLVGDRTGLTLLRPIAKGPGSTLSWTQSTTLAVALGANAWGGGLGAAMLGLPLAPIVAATGVLSALMLPLGAALGIQLSWIGERSAWVAGGLLILLGLRQLL